MPLCDDCLPECDHEYCDNCTKCHLCGVYASAPASPVSQPVNWPIRNPEWMEPQKRIAPAFNEREYLRYAVSPVQTAVQIH